MTQFETKLAVAIESFMGDPPDTQFQHGYLHALMWVAQNYIPTDTRLTGVVEAALKQFPKTGDGR